MKPRALNATRFPLSTWPLLIRWKRIWWCGHVIDWYMYLMYWFFYRSLNAAWMFAILCDQRHRVETSGIFDLHRTVVIFIVICSTSNGADKSWRNPTIAVRSATIEPRSWRDRAAISHLSSRNHSNRIRRLPTEIQDHNWRPIVPRSGLFLMRNSSIFIPDWKPQCRSVQTAPTTP